MEELDNKTIMCSVLFLDIVEYSKKSVSGQISLKDRFNSYLSSAIFDVPITDRIILDTGDGAAINFLGDVEDALKAALSLRESLLKEDVNVDPPLLVRMGVNIGPVRLVRDINGQPNIVGDGINVAQRVMGFADAAQILVSRSYYDAVSRISPQYAGMFHYQGSRTDKHVREHEVYAIGYPGDKTIQRGKANSIVAENAENTLLGRAQMSWRVAASRLDVLIDHPVDSFRQAEPKLRALYVGVVAVPLVLIIFLFANYVRQENIPVTPTSMLQPAPSVAAVDTIQPDSPVVDKIQPDTSVAPDSAVSDAKPSDAIPKQTKKAAKLKKQKSIKPRIYKDKNKRSKSSSTFVKVICKGAEVFVDGARKGRVDNISLTVTVTPGKHALIINHANGVYSKELVFDAGDVVQLNPSFCN